MNRSPIEHGAKMLKFSRFLRSRLALQQTVSAHHLGSEKLAAFAEQSLPPGERANALAHLAVCPECRETLTLISAIEPEEVIAAPEAPHRRFAWCAMRCAATAALVCLIATVVWRTAVIFHTPPLPELVARLPVPPPQTVSAPVLAEQSAPVSPKPRKRSSAKKPASSNNRIKIETQIPYPPPSQESAGRSMREAVPVPNSMFQAESRSPAARLMITTAEARPLQTLWRLSGNEGTLQKSRDGGVTWQSIRLEKDVPLFALSVLAPDIWVGGADATLFHSADGGLHWKRILIADGTSQASGPITRIESRGHYALRVVTRVNDYWITTDGGLHWRRE